MASALNLTSYMDETGHPDAPALEYVGMAGFGAPAGAWRLFEEAVERLIAQCLSAQPVSHERVRTFHRAVRRMEKQRRDAARFSRARQRP